MASICGSFQVQLFTRAWSRRELTITHTMVVVEVSLKSRYCRVHDYFRGHQKTVSGSASLAPSRVISTRLMKMCASFRMQELAFPRRKGILAPVSVLVLLILPLVDLPSANGESPYELRRLCACACLCVCVRTRLYGKHTLYAQAAFTTSSIMREQWGKRSRVFV